MSDSTTTVAAVVIEKMAPLDYFGPLQAFNLCARPGTCPPPDEAAGHDQPLTTPA